VFSINRCHPFIPPYAKSSQRQETLASSTPHHIKLQDIYNLNVNTTKDRVKLAGKNNGSNDNLSSPAFTRERESLISYQLGSSGHRQDTGLSSGG
jgi:hypothetical protein